MQEMSAGVLGFLCGWPCAYMPISRISVVPWKAGLAPLLVETFKRGPKKKKKKNVHKERDIAPGHGIVNWLVIFKVITEH